MLEPSQASLFGGTAEALTSSVGGALAKILAIRPPLTHDARSSKEKCP